MKRALSAHSLRPLFLTRMLAGSLGAGVAVYVLAQVLLPVGMRRELLVAGALVALAVSALVVRDWFSWRRLRSVAVDDQFLYVADHGDAEEVAIPLGDIVRVTQRRGRTFRPVTVHLGSPHGKGQRIQFQPKTEVWGWAFKEDRVVGELRELANAQR